MIDCDAHGSHPSSTCRFCRNGIVFGHFILGEWTHFYGGTYCRTPNGFTATPLHRAEPVLETEVL